MTVQVMRKSGMDEAEIEKVVWRNPISFFSPSGQISFADFGDNEGIDRTRLHQGNPSCAARRPERRALFGGDPPRPQSSLRHPAPVGQDDE
ncbi:MAG: hypothetical protein R3F60_05165 [bacterium]